MTMSYSDMVWWLAP
uniref:Uncharacterized protein n=1 Tax=Pseudomonas putida TaxID=303 RepID=A0A0N9MHK8_PSEPU|nr:hypothetical protein [Pseudomonas putida]